MDIERRVMLEFLCSVFPNDTSSTCDNLRIGELPSHLDELLAAKVKENRAAQDDVTSGRLGPEKACFDLRRSIGRFAVDKDTMQFLSRSNFATGVANTCVFKGKWMYEVILGSGGVMQLGWGHSACAFETTKGVGDILDSYGYDGRRKCKWNVGRWKYGEEWITGDVIQCLIDLDEGTVSYARNGKFLGIAFDNVKTGPSYAYFPAVSLSPGDIVQANFGIVPFQYPIEGYRPIQEPPYESLIKASTLLECLERMLPYFIEVDDQPNKCLVSRQHLLLICDCILQRLGPLLIEDRYIGDSILAEYFDKHTDLEEPQPMIQALLDVFWTLLEKHEREQILLNLADVFDNGYQLSSTDAKLEKKLKYLKLNLILLQHKRTRKLLLKRNNFLPRYLSMFWTRTPDADILKEMIPDAGLDIDEVMKGPITESALYKKNVERLTALLRQADDLRITIIETFMTDNDTTHGPSTRSLFVENIRQFVITWIEFMDDRSMNAALSGFFCSLLPVMKQDWERAVTENPKYSSFEDAYIPLKLFCTGGSPRLQRIGGVVSHLDKVLKDDLAEAKLVKLPKADSEATSEQNRAPIPNTQGTPASQSQTKSQGQGSSTDTVEISKTQRSASELDQGVKSADNTNQSGDASIGISQSDDSISNINLDEPMRRDILQLLDAMVMLYSASVPKVRQESSEMKLIKDCELNIKKTKEKLERCPEGLVEVRNELERTQSVFVKHLAEHARLLMWIDASGLKPEDVAWLDQVLLKTFEKGVSKDKLFSYLPEFYVTSLCQTDDFVLKCQERKVLPVNEERIRRFLTLMCTLIGDKRIISQMIQEQIFDSLSFYLERGKYIPVIESLPEDVREKFLTGVLQLHDSQMWGPCCSVLVKFWKGYGFAFRYTTSPGLKGRITDVAKDKEEEKKQSEGLSVIFQNQLGEILCKNDKLALHFLHSVLDKVNTEFSEFISMVQQFVHVLMQTGNIKVYASEIRLCAIFYSHTVYLLRVIEFICYAAPEILTDWSKPWLESMLCRMLQSVVQILNRVTAKGCVNAFDEICEIDHFPIMAALAGVIVQIVVKGTELSKERAASVLVQEQGFTLDSLEFMLSGEGPRGAMVMNKNQTDVDFSFRKYPDDITEEEVNQLEEAIRYLKSKQLLVQREPSLKEEDLCTICYANTVTTWFHPCKHVSCWKCINQHLLNSVACFFCQKKIIHIESIHPEDSGQHEKVERFLAEIKKEHL